MLSLLHRHLFDFRNKIIDLKLGKSISDISALTLPERFWTLLITCDTKKMQIKKCHINLGGLTIKLFPSWFLEITQT